MTTRIFQSPPSINTQLLPDHYSGGILKQGLVLFLSVLLVLIITGCGAAHVKTQGQSTNLREYDRIVVGRVDVYSREVAAKDNAELQDKLSEWQNTARQQLANYVETIQAQLTKNGADNTSAKVLVANLDMEVTYGNRALRYWVGFGAGKGGVNSLLSINDRQSKEEKFSVTSDSDLSIGAFGGDIGNVFESNLEKLLQQYPQEFKQNATAQN